MPQHARRILQTNSPFLQLPPEIRNHIYLYVLPTQLRIDSFATAHTSGFRHPTAVKRLLLTCHLLNEEVLAFYSFNNSFVLLVNYGNKVHYPREAYVHALERVRYLRYVKNLVVEIMVGHRPALRTGAGYRYETSDTRQYLDIIFDTLKQAKVGMQGISLDSLTLVDHSAHVPLLMRQHAEETGMELDEEVMYKPLVDLVRGRSVGRLEIESDNGRLYTVDFV